VSNEKEGKMNCVGGMNVAAIGHVMVYLVDCVTECVSAGTSRPRAGRATAG